MIPDAEGPFRVRVSPGMTRVCKTFRQAEKMFLYYLQMKTPPQVEVMARDGRVVKSTRSASSAPRRTS